MALSDLALSVIKEVPRRLAPVGKDYLFSVQANRPVTSFDFAKAKLDEQMSVKIGNSPQTIKFSP